MRYCSIDVETTGLDPERCQIIEFGAVLDDTDKPLSEAPRFHCLVTHDQIVGEPFALAMNAEILKELDNPPAGTWCLTESQLVIKFAAWLWENHAYPDDDPRFSPAGKNFAAFDWQFLRRLPDWRERIGMRHRAIDPGNLYWLPEIDGEKLPSTKTCYERAGMNPHVKHRALDDALSVCELIRRWMSPHPRVQDKKANGVIYADSNLDLSV